MIFTNQWAIFPDALARLRTICGEIDPYCTWSMPSHGFRTCGTFLQRLRPCLKALKGQSWGAFIPCELLEKRKMMEDEEDFHEDSLMILRVAAWMLDLAISVPPEQLNEPWDVELLEIGEANFWMPDLIRMAWWHGTCRGIVAMSIRNSPWMLIWWRHRIWHEFRFKVPRCTDPATGTRTEERMFLCVGGVCLKKMRLCELTYIYRNILQFPLCIWYIICIQYHTVIIYN